MDSRLIQSLIFANYSRRNGAALDCRTLPGEGYSAGDQARGKIGQTPSHPVAACESLGPALVQDDGSNTT